MKNYCYFNGKITTLDKVKISPYDIGLLRGYGVFDVMCTANGKPFLFDAHWKRFQNSAMELNLKVPINKSTFKETIAKLLKLNGFEKANIRTVLSGGASHNGFAHERGRETFFILIENFSSLPGDVFQKGAGVMTIAHDRDFPLAKITNYAVAIKNQKQKERKKSLEIIYVKDGKALEASTSNFFIVKKNKLITTKDKILVGTTRNVIIMLAKKKGMMVEERSILEKELYAADEVFLTATNKDVVPVVRIDGRKVGDGKVGKNTKIVMELFGDFVKKY
ncbi:MAG: aminotransferase class IV [Parcubacteria group bacterium]|jgi:branched-subunit amino acid aminotransferase/4-amino-4-deoxychorismate lyase